MSKSSQALVKPELLVWARETARIPIEHAAKKLKMSDEKLQSWEAGESRPTIKQLRHMARVYRQSFAVFYLPEPPITLQPTIRDYRRFPGPVPSELPFDVNFEIRFALDRREIILELLEEASESIPGFELEGSLKDDPESLGASVRDALVVSYDEQSKLREARLSFNYWRTILESAGILVFQAADAELPAMRGFSLSLFPMPIVVVNRKDSYTGRVFTMLHELAHIILRTSGICDLDDRPGRAPEEEQTEVFCNHFAGACLVPAANLLSEEIVSGAKEGHEWTDEEISQLSVRYGVSREVILRRLLILDRTSEDFYQDKRQDLLDEYRLLPKKGGWVHPATNAVSTAGKPFVRLVLDAFGAGRITASDVADYLGVRLKHLGSVEQALGMP